METDATRLFVTVTDTLGEVAVGVVAQVELDVITTLMISPVTNEVEE
jgi:hypothetical protein